MIFYGGPVYTKVKEPELEKKVTYALRNGAISTYTGKSVLEGVKVRESFLVSYSSNGISLLTRLPSLHPLSQLLLLLSR